MKKLRDAVGRDIRINDHVAWPIQQGHRIEIRCGVVEKINETGSIAVRPDGEQYLVSVRRVENVIVLL